MAPKLEDLDAWQLANEVRERILTLIARPEVKRDLDFCDQSRRAARSACRNIAEGLGRFGNKEGAHFVNVAIGSLKELRDTAHEALQRDFITPEEHTTLLAAIQRASSCAGGFRRYLLKSEQRNGK